MDVNKVEKINREMAGLNEAIHKAREKQAAAENKIQSLGPDARVRLGEEKNAMEDELESGRGNFASYDQLLTRIADSAERAKEREAAYVVWLSCRSTIKDLEARREKLRPGLSAAYRQR